MMIKYLILIKFDFRIIKEKVRFGIYLSDNMWLRYKQIGFIVSTEFGQLPVQISAKISIFSTSQRIRVSAIAIPHSERLSVRPSGCYHLWVFVRCTLLFCIDFFFRTLLTFGLDYWLGLKRTRFRISLKLIKFSVLERLHISLVYEYFDCKEFYLVYLVVRMEDNPETSFHFIIFYSKLTFTQWRAICQRQAERPSQILGRSPIQVEAIRLYPSNKPEWKTWLKSTKVLQCLRSCLSSVQAQNNQLPLFKEPGITGKVNDQ